MNKSVKIKSVTLFIISILFLIFEVYILFDLFRHINDPWADLGYLIIEMYLFIPRGLLFIFAGFHFFNVSDLKVKNKYYFLSLGTFIILALLCTISLIFSFIII